MKIRRLQPADDVEAIAAIHILKPTAERNGLDASQEHMKRLLERDENYLYLATNDGQPVAYLVAYRVPRIDRDQDMVYLYKIDVAPEYRRQGIGSRMIQFLKEDCRHLDILKMWVGTSTENTAARALFESTGADSQSNTLAEYTYTNP